MLYKKEGSNKWWYSFTFHGQRVQKSSGVENRKEAEIIEAAKRTQLAKGEVGLEDRPAYTIGELLDRLKQRWQLERKFSVQNASLLKKVREDWGTKMADDVAKDDIERYMARRQKQDYALATTNRVLQVLRRAYRLADVTWPKVKLPSEKGNVRTQRYTPDQWQKILTTLPDDGLRDFAEWSYRVGMRKGEASKLTWNMTDEKRTILHVPGDITKNRNPRDILLEGDLAKIIKRRDAARHVKVNGVSTTQLCKYIFHRGGRPIYEFRKSWKTACEAAGVSGRYHDLRATFATDGRKAGNPESVMMKLGGWSTRAVFDRYNLVDVDDERQARKRMEEYRAG